jgi:hypothetical protein
MRAAVIYLFLLTVCSKVFAQQDTVYPAGCYMTIEELKTKTPSKHCRLQVGEKQAGAFLGFGANDYVLTSTDKCFSKKEIRSDMFAYSDGTHLYLNGGKQDLQGAYVGVIARGNNFFAFNGTRTTQEAVGALLMGGEATTGTEAKGRYLYVMDVKTGKSFYATPEYMDKILESYPALKKQYDAEINKGADETMLKYINLSNQVK